MTLALILRPFPTEILPHLLSAHHNAPESQRAAIAMETWNATGGKVCTLEDVEVLYEKLAVGQPILLVKVGGAHVDELLTLTPEYPNTCSCGASVRTGESRRGELWSLAEAPSSVEVPQGVCLACGRRYIGTWSYLPGDYLLTNRFLDAGLS